MLRCPICKKSENPERAAKMFYKALGGKWCVWHICKCGMSIFNGGHESKKSAIEFWDRWAKK